MLLYCLTEDTYTEGRRLNDIHKLNANVGFMTPYNLFKERRNIYASISMIIVTRDVLEGHGQFDT
jgi:hypothetical protein